ncbi:hypothetical protein CASFOL_004713 [Castilleja foliolosa]|uniref:Uncharacterized protein n=1 Tax=Castilleja foliolosa TaxID=1961234 RepID=A0ABD3EBE4_9LAMI
MELNKKATAAITHQLEKSSSQWIVILLKMNTFFDTQTRDQGENQQENDVLRWLEPNYEPTNLTGFSDNNKAAISSEATGGSDSGETADNSMEAQG